MAYNLSKLYPYGPMQIPQKRISVNMRNLWKPLSNVQNLRKINQDFILRKILNMSHCGKFFKKKILLFRPQMLHTEDKMEKSLECPVVYGD